MISPAERTTDLRDRGLPSFRAASSICFVTSSYMMAQMLLDETNSDVGGAEVQLCQLASLLARSGTSVNCIVGDRGESTDATSPEGIRVLTGYGRRGSSAGGWISHKWPALWSALRRADAAIYVTRGASWLAGAVALFARVYGRKQIAWLASDGDVEALGTDGKLPLHSRALWNLGLRSADAVVAQTDSQARRMHERTGRECEIVPNMWIEPPGHTAAPAWDADVLWVGNVRNRKRPMLALEVAERLPDVRFVMVGGGIQGEQKLHEAVVRRAASLPNVRCVGHVPHDQIHGCYRSARLLLHTSAMEGFPNVFLEAWGSGLPVVSTFDPDGVIERCSLGSVADGPDALANAVVGALATPEPARQRIALWVQKHHAPEVAMEAFRGVLLALQEHPEQAGGQLE